MGKLFVHDGQARILWRIKMFAPPKAVLRPRQTIEYTNDNGDTEICVCLEDIIAFTCDPNNRVYGHEKGTTSYTIIIGREQMSWVDVSKECYEFVKSKWVDWVNGDF